MSTILIIALVGAGLGFVLVLYKLLSKSAKIASKIPTNFLLSFLIYALLGLTGFMMIGGTTDHPVLMGILLLIVSLTVGINWTHKLYDKWEWSMAASFWRKGIYLAGIMLTGMVSFVLIFLLCEYRGWPKVSISNDLVWSFMALIFVVLLPLIVRQLHYLWDEIPMISEIIPTFHLPIGTSPPFIETGGPSINFLFIIPLDYGSKESVKSVVALPFNKTLSEAFHYKLHEHNIVQRFAKKIIFAEGNKRSRVYSWRFYRTHSKWWGWRVEKSYLDPKSKLGATINKGETVFVERVKAWDL